MKILKSLIFLSTLSVGAQSLDVDSQKSYYGAIVDGQGVVQGPCSLHHFKIRDGDKSYESIYATTLGNVHTYIFSKENGKVYGQNNIVGIDPIIEHSERFNVVKYTFTAYKKSVETDAVDIQIKPSNKNFSLTKLSDDGLLVDGLIVNMDSYINSFKVKSKKGETFCKMASFEDLIHINKLADDKECVDEISTLSEQYFYDNNIDNSNLLFEDYSNIFVGHEIIHSLGHGDYCSKKSSQ